MVLCCIVLQLCNMMMITMLWIWLSIPTIECYHYYQIKFGIIFPFSNLTGNTWLVVSTSVFMKLWPDLPNQHRMRKVKFKYLRGQSILLLFFQFFSAKESGVFVTTSQPDGKSAWICVWDKVSQNPQPRQMRTQEASQKVRIALEFIPRSILYYYYMPMFILQINACDTVFLFS